MHRSSQHFQRGKRISAGHNFCCRAPAEPGGQGRPWSSRCLSSQEPNPGGADREELSPQGLDGIHALLGSSGGRRSEGESQVSVWHGKARRTLTDSDPACCFFGPNLAMEVWSTRQM